MPQDIDIQSVDFGFFGAYERFPVRYHSGALSRGAGLSAHSAIPGGSHEIPSFTRSLRRSPGSGGAAHGLRRQRRAAAAAAADRGCPHDHDAAQGRDSGRRRERHLQCSGHGHRAPQLPVAEKRRGRQRRHFGHLYIHGPYGRQRRQVQGDSQQRGRKPRLQRSHADSFQRAKLHDAARRQDSHRRPDGHLHGRRLGRHGSLELPVAQERHGHRRRDIGQLHHASRHHRRQRRQVQGDSERLRRHAPHRHIQRSHADSERWCRPPQDHDAADQPDCHIGQHRQVQCGRHGHGATQLPVVQGRRGHRRRDKRQVHHASHDNG